MKFGKKLEMQRESVIREVAKKHEGKTPYALSQIIKKEGLLKPGATSGFIKKVLSGDSKKQTPRTHIGGFSSMERERRKQVALEVVSKNPEMSYAEQYEELNKAFSKKSLDKPGTGLLTQARKSLGLIKPGSRKSIKQEMKVGSSPFVITSSVIKLAQDAKDAMPDLQSITINTAKGSFTMDMVN